MNAQNREKASAPDKIDWKSVDCVSHGSQCGLSC